MGHGRADRFPTAGSVAWPAHWPALLVATGMGVKAVSVHSTLHLDARHVGVAFVAGLAGADRLMLNHPAECVVTTGAGVLADFVDAGVGLSALVIRAAAGQDGRQGATTVVLRGYVAIWTRAEHGTDREAVNHGAGGGVHTGGEGGTEQLAAGVQTGVLAWTVLVLDTLWPRNGHTGNPGIASVAKRTAAGRLVVGRQTLGIGSTGILVQTGIDTVLGTAGAVTGALRVHPAPNHLARHKWVALVAGNTTAVGAVLGGIAFGEAAAGVGDQAGVDTVPVHAGLAVPALAVSLAAHRLARHLGVSHVAGRADADGSVVVNEALGALAAVTRILALSVNAGLAAGAVIVPGAAGRVRQLDRLAARVAVRHPAGSAGTDHGAEGKAVDHGASGGHIAGFESEAGIRTAVVQAGRVVRAIAVHAAFRLSVHRGRRRLGRAGDQRVPDPAGRTLALGVVVTGRAGGAGGTGVVQQAGVDTL